MCVICCSVDKPDKSSSGDDSDELSPSVSQHTKVKVHLTLYLLVIHSTFISDVYLSLIHSTCISDVYLQFVAIRVVR